MKINFQRTTLSTQFIPEIDGLRFFAIITVVLFHFNTALSREMGFGDDLGMAALGGRQSFMQLGWWIARMDLGVKVFFSISGFVLALPFLKYYLGKEGKRINLKQYYVRRLTRLEPPFVVSLIAFTFVQMIVFDKSWQMLSQHFWSGLIYAHIFIFGEPNPINPVTWSLETEAQFYIMVPLIFGILFGIRNNYGKLLFLLFLFLGSIYLRGFFLSNHYDHLTVSLPAFLCNFITGIVFAYLYVVDKPYWHKGKSLFWDVVGICSIFMIFFFYKPQAYWLNNVLFNVAVFLLMAAAFKGKLSNTFFSNPFIYIVGGMCYSIYLLHFAFFHLLVKFSAGIASGLGYQYDYLLQLFIALPSLLFVSGLFFVLIERPCMDKKWPEKILGFLRKND